MPLNVLSRLVFLLAAGVVILCSFAPPKLYLWKDLQDQWMVHENASYRPYTSDDAFTSSVYFRLDASLYPGKHLAVEGKLEKAIFVEGKLVGSGVTSYLLRLDSLQKIYGRKPLLVGIFQSPIHERNLITQIVSEQPLPRSSDPVEATKPASFYRDFVLTAFLVLLIILIIVTQVTKLPLSLLSPGRLFSMGESEDTQLYMRIASGTNILFYLFCSLVVSFYLLIIFRFVPALYDVAWRFHAETFWVSMRQWGTLSLIVLGIVLVKIAMVYMFSRLFALTEFFGFHVVNWIRIMLVVFGFLSMVLMAYFISHGTDVTVYNIFFWCLVFVWLGWLIILFAKVARRSGFSMFHIFSYLCATEAIPLLILVKLLYH